MASECLGIHGSSVKLSYYLPLHEAWRDQGTCRIERLLRPAEGSGGKWSIWFTMHYGEAERERHYQIELDPGHRWWATRVVGEQGGRRSNEMEAEYEYLGDVLMPVACRVALVNGRREVTVQHRVRPMLQTERQQFKRRVERASRLGPDPFRWWRSFLWGLGAANLLAGVMLLAVTRSGEQLCEAKAAKL